MAILNRVFLAACLGLVVSTGSGSATAQSVSGWLSPNPVIVGPGNFTEQPAHWLYNPQPYDWDYAPQPRYYPQFQPPLPVVNYPPHVSRRIQRKEAELSELRRRELAERKERRHGKYAYMQVAPHNR